MVGAASLLSSLAKRGPQRWHTLVPHNIGEGVGKRGKAWAASDEIALGEAKELIVALDCVEIDQLQTSPRS